MTSNTYFRLDAFTRKAALIVDVIVVTLMGQGCAQFFARVFRCADLHEAFEVSEHTCFCNRNQLNCARVVDVLTITRYSVYFQRNSKVLLVNMTKVLVEQVWSVYVKDLPFGTEGASGLGIHFPLLHHFLLPQVVPANARCSAPVSQLPFFSGTEQYILAQMSLSLPAPWNRTLWR